MVVEQWGSWSGSPSMAAAMCWREVCLCCPPLRVVRLFIRVGSRGQVRPPPPRAEKWIANYWVELAPKFFCANLSCADGGGPLLDGLAADWTPEAGVRLRGQLQPQPQPPPPTQSAVHGGHSGGGGDSQSQATVVNPSGGGGRPEL